MKPVVVTGMDISQESSISIVKKTKYRKKTQTNITYATFICITQIMVSKQCVNLGEMNK